MGSWVIGTYNSDTVVIVDGDTGEQVGGSLTILGEARFARDGSFVLSAYQSVPVAWYFELKGAVRHALPYYGDPGIVVDAAALPKGVSPDGSAMLTNDPDLYGSMGYATLLDCMTGGSIPGELLTGLASSAGLRVNIDSGSVAAWSPDGRYLWISTNYGYSLVDLVAGTYADSGGNQYWEPVFADSEYFYSTWYTGVIAEYHVSAPSTPVRTVNGPSIPYAVTPDRTRLVAGFTGSSQGTALYDLSTGAKIVDMLPGGAVAVASADMTEVVMHDGNGNLRFYSTATGAELRRTPTAVDIHPRVFVKFETPLPPAFWTSFVRATEMR